MAETITIAGKQLPKNYLYIGGAAALGIVGYAWWTRGGAGGMVEEAEELPAVDTFGDERITPNTVDTFDVSVDTRSGVKTNAEWTQFAISHLAGLGFDSTVVSTALGRFIARQPLNTVDLDIARQAWAVAGEPPEGRPWTIIPAGPTGAAVAPGPVSGLKLVSATPTSVTVGWNATQGASGYELRRDGGGTARKDANTRTHTSSGLKPNTSYRFGVRSVNSANNFGPEAYITVKTTASGTSSGGAIGAPKGVLAVGGDDGYFRVGWTPVPGATSYRIRREGRGAPNRWATVRGTSWASHVKGLRTPTMFAFRVQALGPGGKFGGNTVSNAVVVKP